MTDFAELGQLLEMFYNGGWGLLRWCYLRVQSKATPKATLQCGTSGCVIFACPSRPPPPPPSPHVCMAMRVSHPVSMEWVKVYHINATGDLAARGFCVHVYVVQKYIFNQVWGRWALPPSFYLFFLCSKVEAQNKGIWYTRYINTLRFLHPSVKCLISDVHHICDVIKIQGHLIGFYPNLQVSAGAWPVQYTWSDRCSHHFDSYSWLSSVNKICLYPTVTQGRRKAWVHVTCLTSQVVRCLTAWYLVADTTVS